MGSRGITLKKILKQAKTGCLPILRHGKYAKPFCLMMRAECSFAFAKRLQNGFHYYNRFLFGG